MDPGVTGNFSRRRDEPIGLGAVVLDGEIAGGDFRSAGSRPRPRMLDRDRAFLELMRKSGADREDRRNRNDSGCEPGHHPYSLNLDDNRDAQRAPNALLPDLEAEASLGLVRVDRERVHVTL